MRYLLLGDSQAAGHPGRALEAALRAEGHEVVRRGEIGEGVVTWYTRRQDEVIGLVRQVRPERIVLLFGSNDTPSHPLFDEACAWFSRAGAFYSGPPCYANDERRPIGARIRERVRGLFGRRYLDVWDATRDPRLYAPDGIHLNGSGGAVWARTVLAALPSGFPWLGLGVVGVALVGAYTLVRRWT